MIEKMIRQERTKLGVVIEFSSGRTVRIRDNGSIDLKEGGTISSFEFAWIASVRHVEKD